MSDFHELIKSFPKTRDYVRDFFVYGFKTRNDFKEKSPRTYDNERRRLESWLAPYVRKDYAPGGSSISLAIDSSLLDTNPLFRVWKTKSFTDNDIVLHFLILDLLQDGRPRTLGEITDSLLTQYEALFDIQTVRRKCNAYEKEGLPSCSPWTIPSPVGLAPTDRFWTPVLFFRWPAISGSSEMNSPSSLTMRTAPSA